MGKALKSERVSIRVTKELKEMFIEQVRKSGVSQSAYFKKCIEGNNSKENRILKPPDFVCLDNTISRIQINAEIIQHKQIVEDAKFIRNQVQEIKRKFTEGWISNNGKI